MKAVGDITADVADRPAGPVRIALLGAECSGKSTLARALADRLPGVRVDELLREFCDRQGRTPAREEQHGLMRSQMERESLALAQARREGAAFVVCDSAPLITALYSVELFGDHSLLEPAFEHQRGYALTLLTAIDLPWEADGIQRDGPLARARFDARLWRTLRDRGIAFTPVEGTGQRRLALALDAVRGLADVRGRARSRMSYNRLAR